MKTYTPTSMDHRAFWDALAKDAGPLVDLGKRVGELPARPVMPLASDYLAAKRTNDRARVDTHWQGDRGKLAALVLNRCVNGIDPKDPDDRLLDWYFAYLYEPTWTVSAHLPGYDLPTSGMGQLDLAGTEMSMEMAESREVLLPWMKSVSATLDASVPLEIARRTLNQFVNDVKPVWWYDFSKVHANNWAGVCGGSLLAACVSLETQGFAYPEARKKSIDVLNYFFDKGMTPGGECDEGIGYWNYGVEFACNGAMRLSEAEYIAVLGQKRITQIASYPARSHILNDTFFAGNDSGRVSPACNASRWLADATGDMFLHWWYANYPSTQFRTTAQIHRWLWSNETFKTSVNKAPTHPAARYLEDQQAAIFQKTTDKDVMTFTITGGNNAENHNHNDLGTFQFFVGEKCLIPDLGAPKYTTDFFGPLRYTKYIVAASSGHCCPNINGVEQRAGAEAQGKLVKYSPDDLSIELDLTTAYPDTANLKRWTRSAKMNHDASILLHDEYQTGEGAITHRIWFIEKPKITADGVIETASLHLSLSQRPDKIEVLEFDPKDERLMLRDYKEGETLYRIEATYKTKAGNTLIIDTTIQSR